MFLLTFTLFYLALINSVFTAASYIKERMDLFNTIRVVEYVGQIVVLVGCFACFTPDVWYVGLGAVVTSVVTILGYIVITRRYLPEAKLRNGMFLELPLKNCLAMAYGIPSTALGIL